MKQMTRLAVLFATTMVGATVGTALISPHGSIWAHDGAPDIHQGAHSSAQPPAVDVEIIIREGGHPILKGQQTHGQVLRLVAGESIVLALRNEDIGPREFISPLFTRTEIHFVGRATGMFRKDAAGFRLNPGDTLTLQFMAPYSGFHRMYDLIWCSHDGKAGTEVQELLIVMTEEKM
jgi:hypothetical protein